MRRTTEQYNVLMHQRSKDANLAEARRQARKERKRGKARVKKPPQKVALPKLGPPRKNSGAWPTVLAALSMRWLKK